jgi:NADP-dependent 3-hydroxy acid dehydrogenase YdfG
MKTLTDKVVVITGAGSGIGRALALQGAEVSAKLALSDVNEAGLQETLGKLPKGTRTMVRRLDVADREAVFAFAREVRSEYGQVDVVINNAGVSLSDKIGHMKLEDFQWLFNINFWGVVHGVDAFLPELGSRPDAHIVNISSVFGLVSIPSQSAYNASKFAVRGYTEALRQELVGTPIHVTCVHPGGIKTNIVRSGRHFQGPSGHAVDTDSFARKFELGALTTADEAARAIIKGILHNKPRVLIGSDARLLDLCARLAPGHYEKLSGVAMRMVAKIMGI